MSARMLFADERGEIFDHPSLSLMGRLGPSGRPLPDEELIPLPDGTKLFAMPGRYPSGWDPVSSAAVVLDSIAWEGRRVRPQAVCAFLPPGYARTYLPATALGEEHPDLPLWAYAAVGWKEGKFWAAGVRVDETDHWNPEHYDDRDLIPLVRQKRDHSSNRLLEHLERCALHYHCLAAKNLFYGRWECPLPVSPVCNADCAGCLSLQTGGTVPASHERLNFLPTADELVEIAVPHLETAPEAVVSFGQGCEGEPLLQAPLIAEVIRRIRRQTSKGIIHINTNASRPEGVAQLCEAGLGSMRVSLNSCRDDYYHRYYRPRGYELSDVTASLKTASDRGIFTSVNLITFPGFTDQPAELSSLINLIETTRLSMLQWKNLNMDPDLYVDLMGPDWEEPLGIRRAIGEVRRRFPALILGYFNRPKEVVEKKLSGPR
ncbi:MAG: radical SAM protein [Candidatus Omnitrophica bacterium]|nr:radical SAM protein [Candidatus Omnitrophota bacterium]